MSEDNDEPDFGWVDGDEAEETEAPPAQPAKAPPVGHGPPRRPGGSRGSPGRYRRRRAVALVTLVLIGLAAWFAWELWEPFAGSGSGSVTVSIAHGAGSSQIAGELAADHVVASSFFFKLRIALDGDGSKFHPGVYTLRRDMSYSGALALLTKPPKQVSVVIPEGYTRAQIAGRAKADGLTGDYLAASQPSAALRPQTYGALTSVHTLEGFLFPATYFDFQHGSVKTLVAQQLQAFKENFDHLSFAHAQADHLTRYDVLIIASMIEREAEVPSDRALVAAVIYNRLHDGMPLGIDATLRYYLDDYSKPLTDSQLALNTPYNTRIHSGLPPTPISNPGVASMVAAAAPASVSYLYYVDKPNTCGKLAFATTYSEFQTEVAAYNTARNADGGRAPTKCP
jgi:uncharacterized YceG family protein